MYPVGFEEARVERGELWLTGPVFTARVQARGPAWRILVFLRPEDAEKGSFAVTNEERRPLAFENGEVTAPGLPPLRLELDPFAFAFGFLRASGLFARELETWRGVERVTLDPLGVKNPTPVTEGLPLGGGYELWLEERPERRYFGLGERTGFLDKKGRRYTHWNTDDVDHEEGTDNLYQSQPFLLAAEDGRALGLVLDETWRTVFDLARSDPEKTTLVTPGPTFDLYLLPGPQPKDVTQKLAELTGRPPLPPLWALGYHQCRYSYPDEAAVRAVAAAFKRRGIPLSAIWLDIDHMDGYRVFTFHPERFPDPKGLAEELARDGVRLVAIVDPAVKKEAGYPVYQEGAAIRAYVEDPRGHEVVGEVWAKPAVWPDFTREGVRDWWAGLHRFYTERGVAGIWNDMNDPSVFAVEGVDGELPGLGKTLPPGALHGKRTHLEVHNVYGQCMSRATYQGLRALAPDRRPFVLTRSGFLGIQRYAWVWTGDNKSYWSHLEMSVPMLLNLGLSGVAFAGADIGGFTEDADPELLLRWTWLGAFYPFMRNHSAKTSRRQEPYAFGEPWTGRIAEAIRFRYRLLPYVYALAEEASATGAPLMRPLFWHFPDEPEAYRVYDQFLFGPALLVAPVTRPGQATRTLYLPRGRWQDWWTGEVHEGPGWTSVPAPLERIPLFLREGFAVPLTEPRVPERAVFEPLAFRVFGETAEGVLYEDEGDGYAPGRRGRLVVEGDRGRLEGPFAGRRVEAFRVLPGGGRRPIPLARNG